MAEVPFPESVRRTKMDGIDLSGYSGNLLGSLTVAAVLGIAWCVRNKMKHSRCDLDSGCLKMSAHEDDDRRSTIRLEVLEQLRKEGVIPPKLSVGEV